MKDKYVLMCIGIMVAVWALVHFTPKNPINHTESAVKVEDVVEDFQRDYEETKASGRWSLYKEFIPSSELE